MLSKIIWTSIFFLKNFVPEMLSKMNVINEEF